MADEEKGEWDVFDDMLPPSFIPVDGIRVLKYLNADGDEVYDYQLVGSKHFTNVLGLFEAVKLDMYQQTTEKADG